MAEQMLRSTFTRNEDKDYPSGTLTRNQHFDFGMECGEFMRMYRRHHMDLYTNENFDMIEAHSLGLNNVIFCFKCLGLGICLALINVIVELTMMEIFKEQMVPRTNESG